MWDELVFNEPLVRTALEQANILARHPLHWIKIGNSDASSHKVVFLALNDGQDQPVFVLKAGRLPTDHERLKAECTIQRRIFEMGLDVPIVANPIGFFVSSGFPVMMEEWLPGTTLLRKLYLRLRVNKSQVKFEIETIVNQLLIPIQQETLNPTFSWDLKALLSDTLEGIRSADSSLVLPAQFEQKLRRLAQQFPAQAIPCTGAHGDFWPGNISMDQGHFKILDWEAYEPKSNPFHDLYFFIVTYAMSIRWNGRKRMSSVEAVQYAFTKAPWFFGLIRSELRAFCEVYELPREAAFLLLAIFYLKMAVSFGKPDQSQSDWPGLAQDFVNRYEHYRLLFTDYEDQKW